MIKTHYKLNHFYNIQTFILLILLIIGCSINKNNEMISNKKNKNKNIRVKEKNRIISNKKNNNKDNIVVSMLPVVDAFEKRKQHFKIKEYLPINRMQKLLLKEYKHYSELRQYFNKYELKSKLGTITEINRFLNKDGSKLKLRKTNPFSYGLAAILKFTAQWRYPGEEISLKLTNGHIVPGVLMEIPIYMMGKKIADDLLSFKQYPDLGIVAKIPTINDRGNEAKTFFYISKAHKVIQYQEELYQYAKLIVSDRAKQAPRYMGLKYPMVNLDLINRNHWAKNMTMRTNANSNLIKIIQAQSQNILKMDHKGAVIESYFAVEEAPLEEGEDEYKYLVIDGPMLVFITKETKRKKYIVAAYYLVEKVFQDPKDR